MAANKLAISLTSPRVFTAPIQKPLISFSGSSSSSSSSTRVSSIRFNGYQKSVRFFVLKATADQQGKIEEDETVDSKILQYCSIDKKDKKSLGSDEQRFLEASMAYVSGKPILSDAEFDDLKLKLKMDGSEIVAEGPRCSLRSRKVYSDLSVDYLKMLLLNVPATVVALGLFFFLDDLTGFEITYLLELPEPFSFIFTWFAAVPLIVYLAGSLTKLIVKDFLILKGPCPNCGTENQSFYGTILSISSGGTTNKVKCSNCETPLLYDSKTRLITLPEGSQA